MIWCVLCCMKWSCNKEQILSLIWIFKNSRWLFLGTPVSSYNKIDPHNIAEILLKVVLNTITLTRHMAYYHFSDSLFAWPFLRYDACILCWNNHFFVIQNVFFLATISVLVCVLFFISNFCYMVSFQMSDHFCDVMTCVLFLFWETISIIFLWKGVWFFSAPISLSVFF